MEIGSYRKISTMAIICFVFALLACLLAFSNKALLVFPILTAMLSVVTLILMHLSKKKLMGFSLAAVALFVSVFSFTLFATYHQKKYDRLHETAIAHGNTWLQFLKTNQPHIAYQLHIPITARKEHGFNLVDHYGSVEQPKSELAAYLAMEPEKSILADGENAKIEIDSVIPRLESKARAVDFFIIYRYKRLGEDKPRLFSCQLRRFDSLISGPEWHIIRVENVLPKTKRSLPQELKDAALNG